MDIIQVDDVEDLLLETKKRKVYIYGAKTIAWRAEHYLRSNEIAIEGYVVSKTYEKRDDSRQDNVYYIEDMKEHFFDCIVLAVSREHIWSVVEKLGVYNIQKLVIISPFLDDAFPEAYIVSDQSTLSAHAFIHKKVQIICDENSKIYIEDDVMIEEGTIIVVSNNSTLVIKQGVKIGKNSHITVESDSKIEIGQKTVLKCGVKMKCSVCSDVTIADNVVIGEDGNVFAEKNSIIDVGCQSGLSSEIHIVATENGKCMIKNKVYISSQGKLMTAKEGYIKIGRGTTINSNAYIGVFQSFVEICEDCMLSFYVKMNTGNHTIIEKCTQREVTNRLPIILHQHVWVGMGATLLAGCEVGEGSIVGANTIVNKKIPENSICVGPDARIVRQDIEWQR